MYVARPSSLAAGPRAVRTVENGLVPPGVLNASCDVRPGGSSRACQSPALPSFVSLPSFFSLGPRRRLATCQLPRGVVSRPGAVTGAASLGCRARVLLGRDGRVCRRSRLPVSRRRPSRSDWPRPRVEGRVGQWAILGKAGRSWGERVVVAGWARDGRLVLGTEQRTSCIPSRAPALIHILLPFSGSSAAAPWRRLVVCS